MRKMSIWLTTALTVVAMGYYYNLSRSGDGKEDTRPAAAQTAEPATTQPDDDAANDSTTGGPEAAGEDGKAEDPDATD